VKIGESSDTVDVGTWEQIMVDGGRTVGGMDGEVVWGYYLQYDTVGGGGR